MSPLRRALLGAVDDIDDDGRLLPLLLILRDDELFERVIRFVDTPPLVQRIFADLLPPTDPLAPKAINSDSEE